MSKPTDEAAAVSFPSHVLPKDLANAIKYLGDEELDRLITAACAEIRRRGRQLLSDKPTPEMARDLTPASLTRGHLNAVRAAFKAGLLLCGSLASSAYPNRTCVRLWPPRLSINVEAIEQKYKNCRRMNKVSQQEECRLPMKSIGLRDDAVIVSRPQRLWSW
jgi:hypothetical protein